MSCRNETLNCSGLQIEHYRKGKIISGWKRGKHKYIVTGVPGNNFLFAGRVLANNFLKAGRVPANNFLFAGRVPANNFLKAGRVPANNFLFAGRVPANNLFQNII